MAEMKVNVELTIRRTAGLPMDKGDIEIALRGALLIDLYHFDVHRAKDATYQITSAKVIIPRLNEE